MNKKLAEQQRAEADGRVAALKEKTTQGTRDFELVEGKNFAHKHFPACRGDPRIEQQCIHNEVRGSVRHDRKRAHFRAGFRRRLGERAGRNGDRRTVGSKTKTAQEENGDHDSQRKTHNW